MDANDRVTVELTIETAAEIQSILNGVARMVQTPRSGWVANARREFETAVRLAFERRAACVEEDGCVEMEAKGGERREGS